MTKFGAKVFWLRVVRRDPRQGAGYGLAWEGRLLGEEKKEVYVETGRGKKDSLSVLRLSGGVLDCFASLAMTIFLVAPPRFIRIYS